MVVEGDAAGGSSVEEDAFGGGFGSLHSMLHLVVRLGNAAAARILMMAAPIPASMILMAAAGGRRGGKGATATEVQLFGWEIGSAAATRNRVCNLLSCFDGFMGPISS